MNQILYEEREYTWSNFILIMIQQAKKVVDLKLLWASPCGSGGKQSACNQGDPGSIPGSGRSPEKENGYLLQYSCLENPTDREAWQATVSEVAKSMTWLSDFHFKLLKIANYKLLYRI